MISAPEWLGIAVLGGVVALDRAALLQGMWSRPLVSASLAGAWLNHPELGLACGVLLELLWLMNLPVGASVPPDDALVGVLAAVFAAVAPVEWSLGSRAALGAVTAVPFGYLGRWLDVGVRRWNAGLVPRARRQLERGQVIAVGRYHVQGALRFFLAGAGAAVGASALGRVALEWGVARAPAGLDAALEIVAWLLPLLGAAAVMAHLRSPRAVCAFSAGMLGAAAWPGGGRWPKPWSR